MVHMSVTERKPWQRDELMLAINLYCKTPFGRIHVRNPAIIELAELLGRTPGSVSYKLANFASIDPSLDRKGASNVSRLDRETWNEFYENWDEMAFESEQLSAKIHGNLFQDDSIELPIGKTREAQVKVRVNQNFFRQMVLSSYNFNCCITGLPLTELLVASHIKPWAIDEKNRMNPRNGLCLNALHDKAFDKGLITIDENFKVVVSSLIQNASQPQLGLIQNIHGVLLKVPNRFRPDPKLLDWHRTYIFRG
jgi:putative restriction endonuclease